MLPTLSLALMAVHLIFRHLLLCLLLVSQEKKQTNSLSYVGNVLCLLFYLRFLPKMALEFSQLLYSL